MMFRLSFVLVTVQFLLVTAASAQVGFREAHEFVEGSVEFGIAGQIVDLNEDGKLDVLVSGQDGDGDGLEWLENLDGRGNSFAAHVIDRSHFFLNAQVIDFDGDGDVDILGRSRNAIHFLENLGDAASFTDHELVSTDRGAFEVVLGDVDGDGQLDLVTTGDTLVYYLNLGSDPLMWGPAQSISDRGGSSLAVGDFDGDGDLDVAHRTAFNDEPELRTYRNQDGTWEEQIMPLGDGGRFTKIDFDGDGDEDLLHSGETRIEVLDNRGDMVFASELIYETPINPSTGFSVIENLQVAYGDFDNDGDMDLVVSSNDADSGGAGTGVMGITFFQNDGDGFSMTDLITKSHRGASLSAGDMDCDGDLDLFFGLNTRANADQAKTSWLENTLVDAATESCHPEVTTTCEERGDCETTPPGADPGSGCAAVQTSGSSLAALLSLMLLWVWRRKSISKRKR